MLEDGKTIAPAWVARFGFIVRNPDGEILHKYVPTPKQVDFHESEVLNCIMEGRRGTGKSWAIRNDAHMRSLALPGFTYMIVRRTMGELKKTHLKFIDREMDALGGTYNKTDGLAKYPNGSLGFYASCNSEEEMLKLLGGDYHAIYFDEITTFTGEQIGKIGTCLRVPVDLEAGGLLSVKPRIRGGTNPIGVGADYVHSHYITKDVSYEEEPDYNPNDYEAIHTVAADNPYITAEYDKQFSGVPAHIRRAWMHGEWIVEGAYFNDFMVTLEGQPWHVINELPLVDGKPFLSCPWIQIYRSFDWGFSPDPAVCLWIASLPNGRAIAFREQDWLMTTAAEVASTVKKRSDSMRVVESYADPTMFANQKATELQSIGDIFAANGVSLTPSRNDRSAIGFAIHEWLNTILEDGLPKLQIFAPGCPKLVKTLPMMRIDPKNPTRIADSKNDHWTITAGYFCMGRIGVSKQPTVSHVPIWMRPKAGSRWTLGRESVRRAS